MGLLTAVAAVAAAALPPARGQDAPAPAPPPDGYSRTYARYRPAFMDLLQARSPSRDGSLVVDEDTMRMSREKQFFSLTVLDEEGQAYALIKAAMKAEASGETRAAVKLYQQAVEKYPYALCRVSDAGVFVTVGQYCQRRILGLPAADLAFYRTTYDPKAREVYEQARSRYSLAGFQEIADTMLATSYGDNALAALGDAALDAGNYEEALGHYRLIGELFAGSDSDTPELAMKLALCLRKLGRPAASPATRPAGGNLTAEQLARLRQAVETSPADGVPPDEQQACPPYLSASDYVRFEPVTDAMALDEPAWRVPLPGARGDYYVFTQPVVAGNSVLYRHKNIVYCRSILNGELRWTFDTGGRLTWQNPDERQYPPEELAVSDGMVYTCVVKAGPSLVALDLTTGQLRWASGRIAPATAEDTRIRYEAAPAVGPQTVYAGYVRDDIEGDTHIDTTYGLRAFDAASGRVLWDTPLCHLAPGRFTTGVAVSRRNRIRSFCSPPVLHQGILYYCTNAGAVAAVNARSGRVEWLALYPYWPSVHDASQRFGARQWYLAGPHLPLMPMGWYGQRPLVLGGRAIVGPLDSPCLMSIDRATGKVAWVHGRPGGGHGYFLGPTSQGELVLAFSGREGSIQLLDPASGTITWRSPDPIRPESSPALNATNKDIKFAVDIQNAHDHPYWLGARPMLTRDDQLYVASFDYVWPNMSPGGWVQNLAAFSLKDRRLLEQRYYYDAGVRARAEKLIREEAPLELATAKPGPQRDLLETIAADQVPTNAHGPFRPFSRLTFTRYGTRFELRTDTAAISMCYDRAAVAAALADAEGPQADFARAELALAESRYTDAAALLDQCLQAAGPDDVDFRAAVNQQLYRVQLAISQTAIRKADPAGQVSSALELYRRAGTSNEEVQSLLALSEAYERIGSPADAARCLRSIVRYYGRRPYGVPALAMQDRGPLLAAAGAALDAAAARINGQFFAEPAARGIELMRAAVPLYASAVSPLPPTLQIEAGPLATGRLLDLANRGGEPFTATVRAEAAAALAAAGPEERLLLAQEYPGTPAAGEAMAGLFAEAAKATGLDRRKALWELAEVADLARAPVPDAVRAEAMFPAAAPALPPLAMPMAERMADFQDPDGGLRMVLARRGDVATRPELAFAGGRAKRRLDNKFELAAVDCRTGRRLWTTAGIRLRGAGQEPGFTESFVRGDLVLVHGFYDVLAFRLADGKVAWHYEVPFDFEIAHALAAGDLLILAGTDHTLALYVPTDSPTGEVVWSVPEAGEPYVAPYVHGERLISVRQLPSGVTVRRLGTGRLLGRLELADLSRFAEHPLGDVGPEAVPFARHGERLFLTDGWYYIAVDTVRLRILWKRLIDANDPTREPPLRLAAGERVLLALKQDYLSPAMYALDAATGKRLWRSDATDPAGAPPVYSAVIDGGRIFGLTSSEGRSFTVHALDAATGRPLAKWSAPETYQGRPRVELLAAVFGGSPVARVQDGQSFELIALDGATCKPLHTLRCKAVGPWDMHGRVSGGAQDGRLLLMNAERLQIAGPSGPASE